MPPASPELAAVLVRLRQLADAEIAAALAREEARLAAGRLAEALELAGRRGASPEAIQAMIDAGLANVEERAPAIKRAWEEYLWSLTEVAH